MRRPGLIGLVVVCAACTVPPTWEQVPWDTGVFTDPAGTLTGTVQNAGGDPVAAAHLTTDPHGYEASTDPQGKFTFPALPPGTYALQVAADGFVPSTVSDLQVTDSGDVDVQVPLDAVSTTAGTVRVAVQGPDGAPLEGAVVEDSTGQQVTADATGTAKLTDLGGQVVDLSIADAAGAYWGRTVTGVRVAVGGTVDVAVQLSGKPPADAQYVGSATCRGCHFAEEVYNAAGPHGQALSPAVGEHFLRKFATGTVVRLAHGTARLSVVGDTPQITLTADLGGSRDFVVAGVLGDDARGSVPFTEIGDQAYPLPVAWVARDPDFGSWPETAARVVPYQESTWIDETGQFTFSEGDRPSPALSADARCFACHATGFTLTPRDDGGVDLAATSGDGRWVDGFVGCERCHGPGSAHLAAALQDRAKVITEPWLLDADRGIDVCGQCHSRTEGVGNDLPYPYSSTGGLFHPGDALADHGTDMADLWAIGAAAAPNEQADELKVGAHSGSDSGYALRCWDCHDPHGSTTDASGAPLPHLLRLEDRDDTLCLSCHQGLSFGGDQGTAQAHPQHYLFDPAGPSQGGRCVRCHMPRTAARLAWHAGSGAGDLSSHLFTAIPPQAALDVFADQGTSVLPVGSFPIHSCAECHAYNAWSYGEQGLVFPGPHGDPTRIETHQAFQQAYQGKFP